MDVTSRQSTRRHLWRDGPRIPSLLLFGLVALSVLGAFVAIFQNLSVERAQREQVARTSEIAAALRDSSRALIDAETGQRGYVLTQDPDYLMPYLDGSRAWPVAQERLERQLEGIATERQDELLSRSRALGEEKLQELDLTVEMVEQGQLDEARALVRSGEGRNIMVEYRAVIGELEDIESQLVRQASARAAASEQRFVPILIGLAIVLAIALALGLWQVFRVAKAEAEAATARSLAQARDRADLLSRELNHRVKNLFAVIQAIVQMSLRPGTDAQAAKQTIIERIRALSIAHSVTQGELETPVTLLGDLVRTAVAPYLTDEDRFSASGPEIEITADQATPLGLILHELVTNCVKYGAWSPTGGKLEIDWSIDPEDPRFVNLRWTERAAAPGIPPESEGFGTRLITASVQQLDGAIDRQFTREGLDVRLRFARS